MLLLAIASRVFRYCLLSLATDPRVFLQWRISAEMPLYHDSHSPAPQARRKHSYFRNDWSDVGLHHYKLFAAFFSAGFAALLASARGSRCNMLCSTAGFNIFACLHIVTARELIGPAAAVCTTSVPGRNGMLGESNHTDCTTVYADLQPTLRPGLSLRRDNGHRTCLS